jgi:hypothetical protein
MESDPDSESMYDLPTNIFKKLPIIARDWKISAISNKSPKKYPVKLSFYNLVPMKSVPVG